MTTMLARGATSSVSNPVLVLAAVTQGNTVTPDNLARAGMLLEAFSASWRILDFSDPTAAPAVIASGAVDVVTDRLSQGRYAANWLVPDDENLGEHRIEWTYRFFSGDPPIVRTDRFDVIPKNMRKPGYCTVQDLLDEGFNARDASEKRMWIAIQKATAMVDRFTGRFFEARFQTIKVNGSGNRMVLLNDPIIALESMTFDTSPFSPADLPIDSSLYRVYSRHITEGLTNPDDRENPKVELFYSSEDLVGRRAPYSFTSLIFPRGQQNITMTGVFGYTEPDGGTVGETPPLIRHATMLIASGEMYTLKGGRDAREDFKRRGSLISESTRDQSYTLNANAQAALSHSFTGNPEVDQILAQYCRPPNFAGV